MMKLKTKTPSIIPLTGEEYSAKINESILEKYREKFKTFTKARRMELEASIGWLFFTDDIKKKKREQYQKILKTNDILMMILAFIGIVTNIISSSIYLQSKKVTNSSGKINMELIPKETTVVLIFRIITTITTIVLEAFLIRHYIIRMKFLKFKQKINITANIYSTGFLWKLLAESCICLIHSPPLMNNICLTFASTTSSNQTYSVDLDLFLSSIIPLRVYLLVRYYSFYSEWADDCAEKICNECNTLGGISFAIKAELKERPFIMVGILMFFSILIFGYALRNVELGFMQYKDPNYFQDWSITWNGFWCIMITIFTVGYGDFYPQTILGRLITVVACLWGTFLISLMVVSLTISVEFTPQEQKAYNEIKKGELLNELKRKALIFIRYAYKLINLSERRIDIEGKEKKKDYIQAIHNYNYSLHAFRTKRKYRLSQEQEMAPNTILNKIDENICDEMEELIFSSNNQVNALLEYLTLSEGIQEEIKGYVDKLDIMTKGLEDCLQSEEEKENECEIQTEEIDLFHKNL